jgi:putative aldouronate transport system permease protein
MSMNAKPMASRKTNSPAIWFRKKIAPNWICYLFLLPVLIYAAIFWYAPMFGLTMSFQRYNPGLGFFKSPWVGFSNFKRFFDSYMCWTLIENTLYISLYSFIAGLPIPIIMALAFQYCPRKRFTKTVQTITYAPYFISVVVLVAMLTVFTSPRTGLINLAMKGLGVQPVNFMADAKWFRHVYVWSGVWQGAGWSSIIYTAALSGSDPQLHEAAIIDGASKWKRIWYIDLPVIAPTFIILQIMSIGNIMSVGFEKAYLMQNSANIMVSEIISTYTYTLGVKGGEVSYTTAIGLFNNVVNFALLLGANFISGKVSKISVM